MFYNKTLNTEITQLKANKTNISGVSKSNVGNGAIDIDFKEPVASETYIYKNIEERDADYNELIKLFPKK